MPDKRFELTIESGTYSTVEELDLDPSAPQGFEEQIRFRIENSGHSEVRGAELRDLKTGHLYEVEVMEDHIVWTRLTWAKAPTRTTSVASVLVPEDALIPFWHWDEQTDLQRLQCIRGKFFTEHGMEGIEPDEVPETL